MTNLVETRRVEGDVWNVTLNRDAKRNALSVEMCGLIAQAFTSCVDAGARAIILDARGSVFSAGADLSEPDFHNELYPALERLFADVQRLPAPVLAYVHGPAIGAGMLLAMACDLRFVGPDPAVYFSLPVTHMAIGVDTATVHSLELLVGGAWARRILLLGERMPAADAVSSGFAIPVGSHDAVVERAASIANAAPLTVSALKMEFAHSGSRPFSTGELNQAREEAWLSDDNAEVRRARAEKRPPKFTGS